MAGLSSVMAITRPLGEVNLAAMNRCVGVYKIYLVGGGGGGGGISMATGHAKYGYPGGSAVPSGQSVRFQPPISVSVGGGGSVGGDATNGTAGKNSQITDTRGINIQGSGAGGGTAAYYAKLDNALASNPVYGQLAGRFNYAVSTNEVFLPPYATHSEGRGGGSTSTGNAGGLIKAFRIG